MKSLQKKVTIALWVLESIISLFGIISGTSKSLLIIQIIGMTAVSTIATILYFCKNIPDERKAYSIFILISTVFIMAAYALGGSLKCYLIVYIVLGLTSMYFNKKILLVYSFVTIVEMILSYCIKPIGICGADYNAYYGLVVIVSYIMASAIIYYITSKGEQLIYMAEQQKTDISSKRTKITEQNESVKVNSELLFSNVLEGGNNIETLKSNSFEMIEVADTMTEVLLHSINAIQEFNTAILDGQTRMEEYYSLIDELKLNSTEVFYSSQKAVEEVAKTSSNLDLVTHIMTKAEVSSEELLKATDKIASILTDINNITKQTTLLSLNASIEASRAGEQGAGFAVVAEEVRSLSLSSENASNDIEISLNNLSHSIETVSKQVAECFQSSKDTIKQVETMTNGLDEISSVVVTAQETVEEEFEHIQELLEYFEIIVTEVTQVVGISKKDATLLQDIKSLIETKNSNIKDMEKNLRIVQQSTEQLNLSLE